MTKPLVTILLPNYKTLQLTKLCLRLLRKNTNWQQAKVIVIDNDSQDESVEYLRSLDWITLIERPSDPNENVYYSHSRALDLALEQVDTPYVLSLHTDSLVKNDRWLNFLLTKIQKDENIAGVGSWKLEDKPFYQRIAKSIERVLQQAYYKLIGKRDHAIEGVGDNFYYLRSHCALYRMDLLNKYNLKFSDLDGVAGKHIHKALLDNNHEMLFLTSEELGKYMSHLNHATMVLNPELGTGKKNLNKGLRRVKKGLAAFCADQILLDESLDS